MLVPVTCIGPMTSLSMVGKLTEGYYMMILHAGLLVVTVDRTSGVCFEMRPQLLPRVGGYMREWQFSLRLAEITMEHLPSTPLLTDKFLQIIPLRLRIDSLMLTWI